MAQVVLSADSILMVGAQVFISGSVDGVSVTATCPRADLNALGTRAEKVAYVTRLLKEAAPPAPARVDLAGTYTA